MNGKIVGSMLLLVAALTAAAVWYLQVYGFYEDVTELHDTQAITLTLPDGQSAPLPITDFRGIDATSSPLRYRACFAVDVAQAEAAAPYDAPTPLNGPNWFKCYSARALTADLASGAAHAYLAQRDIRPGVDRVIAVYPDGRAFAWHQLNDSAEERRVIE
ncbi:MAG: DUF6446 family protein [Paracoccus sp. (in: a-proteobacteria)]|uniref:DUF6446 family protein n=1 Tax=Paracoccus sp. TaxID=267 RepID=UPI0026E0F4DD|nr:DUF6446 family protein [Paracoccus sp. (in: a-proteobacteria)]MDO5621319.1 DUF6446 family protein [Paracoccus sp. (in: a-proteobacteria)]